MASERDRAALAWVCERHEQIRQLSVKGGVSGELESVLEALARPDGTASALLARVEELLRGCGWAGNLRGGVPVYTPPHTDSSGAGVPSVGVSEGEPLVEAYVCPAGRCSRVTFLADTPQPPVCFLTGGALPLKRYGGYADTHGYETP